MRIRQTLLQQHLNNAVAITNGKLKAATDKQRDARLATLRTFARELIKPAQEAVADELLTTNELTLILAAAALFSTYVEGDSGEVIELPFERLAKTIYGEKRA